VGPKAARFITLSTPRALQMMFSGTRVGGLSIFQSDVRPHGMDAGAIRLLLSTTHIAYRPTQSGVVQATAGGTNRLLLLCAGKVAFVPNLIPNIVEDAPTPRVNLRAPGTHTTTAADLRPGLLSILG
jgi:hypothetical protein